MAEKRKAKPKKGVRKPVRKKAAAKRPSAKKRPVKRQVVKVKAPEAGLEKVGEVTHYFPKVKAAAVLLKAAVKPGDEIYIKGHTTNFKEKIISMQLDLVPIQEGRKGQEIGLLVKSRVRIGDSVYRL